MPQAAGHSGQPQLDAFVAFRAKRANVSEMEALRSFSAKLYQQQLFRDAAWYADQVLECEAGNAQSLASDFEHAVSCHYAAGNYQQALVHLQQLLCDAPEREDYRRFAGLCHLLLGALGDAEHCFLSVLEQVPEDASACDGLAHLYGLRGEEERRTEFGNRALAIKDAAAHAPANLKRIGAVIGRSPTLAPVNTAFDPSEPHRNVIAFSLWGADPGYTQGAILNATLQPAIYPGWSCRFYCDKSVPADVIGQLRGLGADVRVLDHQPLAFFGLFWRFFVAEDPEVRHFLVRDCDCVLNCQERVAVDDWLASGKIFHIMRDYASHTELVHAGMWGGVAGAIPGLKDLIVNYYDHHPKERTIDQRFLRDYLWPFIRQSYLCHDSCFSFGETQPFPELGRYPAGTGNVGLHWQQIYR